MRLRVGHRPEDWLDTGPGYGGSVRLGGELVRSGPTPPRQRGPEARERENAAARESRAKAKAA